MKRRITTGFACAALFLGSAAVHAQEIDHKQADDFAAWLVDDGQHGKAAGLYADAYKEKSRAVYAYEAATLYFAVKDYAKAAKFYQAIAGNSDFPDARRMLARAQKNMADYETAKANFIAFNEKYVAEDSAAVRASVREEIKGIDFAIAEQERVDPTIFVDRFGSSMNSMKNEVSPMAIGSKTIAFLSDFDGTMRAYSSTKGRNGYSQMAPAEEMPVIEEGQISGGTLVTPDLFYFSLCPQSQLMTQPATAKCVMHSATRRGGTWGEPKPLPGNINVEGSSAVQPFVFREGNKEIMLFASDRDGTMGGMDIWKAEREVSGEVTVFGTPKNLGSKVNGPGNEVTPFYNPETKQLSFSSDRGTVIGGYDVFQATTKDDLKSWTAATNPGTPVNSSGDDYYYREVVGTSRAFISSNRSAKPGVTNLTNDELFEVSYDNKNITVNMLIVEDGNGQALTDATLRVSVDPDGMQLKPLIARRSLDGTFELTLPVDRDLVVNLDRPYFNDKEVTVYIPQDEADGYEVESIRLHRAPVGPDDVAVTRSGQRNAPGQVVKRKVMTASGEVKE